MEVDAPLTTSSDRTALLKRKANDSINEILSLGQGQSTSSPSKKLRKNLLKLRDMESYKKIIQTYRAPIWYGCAVSPRDLADFGWACVKKNSVQCIECGQHLNTTLPNICMVSFNVYNCSLKDIHEKMVTAHRSTCKLRSGAPSFRTIESSYKDIMAGITARLEDCRKLDKEELLADIPAHVSLPKIEGVPPNFVYFAATGWNVSLMKRGCIIAGCDLCARELAIRSGNKFDPIHNHERWCPRIENDEHGEPSWQNDLNILLNTKNRISNRYIDSQIFKEAYAARRLLDSGLTSQIIPPGYNI